MSEESDKPRIPQPLYWSLQYEDKKYQCPVCHERYQTRKSYKGHYALVHILGLE